MAEVPVAFPNDEVSAEEIAAQMRAAGIAARVDRGLHGSWQLPAQGQMTVYVNAKDGARAHKILGTTAREEGAPGPALRIGVAVLIGALVLGIVAIAVTLLSRPPDFRPFVMSIEDYVGLRWARSALTGDWRRDLAMPTPYGVSGLLESENWFTG